MSQNVRLRDNQNISIHISKKVNNVTLGKIFKTVLTHLSEIVVDCRVQRIAITSRLLLIT